MALCRRYSEDIRRSINPKTREHSQLEGVHREGECERCHDQQANDANWKRAHQDAARGKTGDNDEIPQGGEQHDRRGSRAPKTTALTQNIEISLPCKDEHSEGERLHLARAQAQKVPTGAENRHKVEKPEQAEGNRGESKVSDAPRVWVSGQIG